MDRFNRVDAKMLVHFLKKRRGGIHLQFGVQRNDRFSLSLHTEMQKGLTIPGMADQKMAQLEEERNDVEQTLRLVMLVP